MQWRNIMNFHEETEANLRLADGAATDPILLRVCTGEEPAPIPGVRMACLRVGQATQTLPLLMATAIRLLRAEVAKHSSVIPHVFVLGMMDTADAALNLTCHWQEEEYIEALGVPYDWYPSGAVVLKPSAETIERAIGARRIPLYMVAEAKLMPLLSRMDWLEKGELHLTRADDERIQAMIADGVAYLRKTIWSNNH